MNNVAPQSCCLRCHQTVPHIASFCPRCGETELVRFRKLDDGPESFSTRWISALAAGRYAIAVAWIGAALSASFCMVVWAIGLHRECEQLGLLQRLQTIWTHLPAIFYWSLAVTLSWLLLIPIIGWARD